MGIPASALSRPALDSQADVETTLYKRPAQAPSGIQRIVPARVLEVKPQPRRRQARALGLNVFLMPRTAADPAPPWVVSAAAIAVTTPRVVVRRRSRWNWVLGTLAFVIAFVAVASPKTRIAVIDRSRPYAKLAWTATKHAAYATAAFSAREWHALRSGRP